MHLDGETRLIIGLPDTAEARTAAVHRVLAEDLGLDEGDRVLAYETGGKPFLVRRPDIGINTSHCEGILLVAHSRRGKVGADLETIERCRRAWEDASRAFSPGEQHLLAELPPSSQPLTFAFLWTGKEAVLKAAGTGILGGLARPDFSALPATTKLPPWDRHHVKLDDERFLVTWYMLAIDGAQIIAARADASPEPDLS